MKKTLSLIIMMMVAVMMGTAGKNDVPVISFDTKTHDFGVIHESRGPVTYEFQFTNTGKAPLVIISATAACGCTTPSFDGEPIAPGKSSAIKVTYVPKGRPGEFSKNVTIRTNDPKNKKVQLRITGNVVK